jgi:hypothetical protein
MLLIHWTEQSKTSDILSNGIRLSTRKRNKKNVRGIWCYPYTRNTFLNNLWKRQLKSWLRRHSNFNGIVFRLESTDFPVKAGPFWATGMYPQTEIKNPNEFQKLMSSFPTSKELPESLEIDVSDFEIILPKRVTPDRIIKIIKDRCQRKTR